MDMISPAPSKDTMAVFAKVIRHSSCVAPSEVEDWVRDVERGGEDPILALIVIRLTKLRTLSFSALYPQVEGYLLRTLDRIMHSSEASILPETSITAAEADGRSQNVLCRHSTLFSVGLIDMNNCEIDLDLFSRLLQSIHELISFDFRKGGGRDLQTFQVHSELLKFSKHSLQRLVLIDNSDEQNNYMLDIACFENLTCLVTELVILLGHDNGLRRSLADVLPASIEEVALRSYEPGCPREIDANTHIWESFCNDSQRVEPLSNDLITRLARQMVEYKTKRLPKLKVLEFEATCLEEGIEEDIAKLEEQCAEVGARLAVHNA